MRKNGLHRLYDQLDPEERFRLDLQAMARGDMQESRRLVDSCPKYSYKMNDRAFAGRWTGALHLAHRAYLELDNYLAKLQMVEAARVMLPYLEGFEGDGALESFVDGHRAGARHAWTVAEMPGAPPEWPHEVDEEGIRSKTRAAALILSPVLDEWEKGLAQRAFDLWAAFSGFCAESMGVEADKLLAVALGEGPGERVKELEELAARLEIEPDAETVSAEREELARGWALVEERGI